MSFSITVYRFGSTPPKDLITCPKCKEQSGDDWSQCMGVCPMSVSPHYDASWKPYPRQLHEAAKARR